MGKINVLSFAVANLIAAGEVVDRPSSVIKELLENAIDSGATRIAVEIQNGGVTYMRVSDNGCGMEQEDLPIAIRRHATSKIREAKDLDGILTLGFRGEALAAIASVSDLRIISKTRDASVGAMLESSGGNILGVTERACSDGTTVIVENLFANVPARRKFLKKDVTESMAVSALVEKIALSKPEIAFRLIIDGSMKLETVGDGNLKNAVYSVFGREFSSKLIPVDWKSDGIEVHGFIGRSDNVRANRNYQNFFINRRYVKSKTMGAALEQAYTSYIPPEKFPCCILFLSIHPAAVDVNVHPAKLEVKFSNEKPVFEAVYYSVRNALESNQTRPNVELKTPQRRGGGLESRLSDSHTPIEEGRSESLKKRQLTTELFVPEPQTKKAEPTAKAETFARMSADDYVNLYKNQSATKVQKAAEPEREAEPPKNPISKAEPKAPVMSKASERPRQVIAQEVQEKPRAEEVPIRVPKEEPTKEEAKQESVPKTLSYRLVGDVFHSYVLVEVENRMLIIDQHAAHERILFEQLKAGMKEQNRASQLLMLPLEVMMTTDEIHALNEFREEIEAVGFAFTNGKYTVNVTAIPEGISTEAVADMLTIMAGRIRGNTGSAKLTRDLIFEKALYQAACKAAIKAGREYPEGHIRWLVSKLMELPDITVCPHGRPVAMELSKKDLDRQFERT